MRPLQFHPAALDEIAAGYEYLYLHANPEVAEDFRSSLERRLIFCQEFPLSFPIRRYQTRRAPLERFEEHYLAYMLWSHRFIVIALGHAKRRPYYWYQRPMEFSQA